MKISEIFDNQKKLSQSLKNNPKKSCERSCFTQHISVRLNRAKNASLESIQKLFQGLSVPIARLFDRFSIDINEPSYAV